MRRTETLSVADAVLGTRIEVPALEGAVEVTVPPGTQPDAVLRLRGKGLPELGEGPRGRPPRSAEQAETLKKAPAVRRRGRRPGA